MHFIEQTHATFSTEVGILLVSFAVQWSEHWKKYCTQNSTAFVEMAALYTYNHSTHPTDGKYSNASVAGSPLQLLSTDLKWHLTKWNETLLQIVTQAFHRYQKCPRNPKRCKSDLEEKSVAQTGQLVCSRASSQQVLQLSVLKGLLTAGPTTFCP